MTRPAPADLPRPLSQTEAAHALGISNRMAGSYPESGGGDEGMAL